MVSVSTSSDWFRAAVSVPAVLLEKSLTASVSEYGDPVRDSGITSSAPIRSEPFGSSVSIRSPSNVLVLMCAVVCEPRRTLPSREKLTTARPPCNRTSETVPTFTPEILTGLPVVSPPASANTA